jgi:hypothetical protein
MTIKPSADVYSTSSDNTNWIIHTNVTTTFTFNAPSGIITNVRFRNGNADVNPSSSSGADTSTYTVTLADNTTFTGFEVTFYATSGSCGENATWELTTDDSNRYTVLTIGGSGAMENYDHINDAIWRTTAPWGYDLRSVTIGDGITSIGNYAFIGCQQLSSLTIGSSVTSIGTNAIDHCDGLTEVTLPASVSTIGNGAFKNCVGLTHVNIERTDAPIITLGSSCFNGCNNLQYIVAPTPALALQYKDATNWSASAGKLRVALGDYLFTATDEGGTAAYAITNEDDLRNLSAAVIAGNTASGYTFRQTANITLGNTGFRPIGKNDDICFSGTYDGGDYTISGLHVIKIDGFYYYGLFGRVKNGTVKNVRLISPSVNVGNVGLQYCYSALVAIANSSTVKNCVVITPTIEGSSGNKGAIIGIFENSYLQNLYFYGGNCNIAVGAGLSHISTVCRARKVTLGSGIGSVSPDANSMDNGFVYNNERYYREGLTLTLTTNLTENTGYHPVYKVNGHAINGNTYTVNSTDGDVTLTAEYTPDIHYIDADGNRQTRSDYTVLTNSTNISNLSSGWYVVESNVSYSSKFSCESGDIHLILCDNAKMTIEPTQDQAMTMKHGSLTVYAQSTGNSMGQLEAISSDRTAIASDLNNITICGGKITATGSTSDNNCGIYADGNITIHGGQVSATGKYGIRAYEGNVILGLRNANDYITANRYNSTKGSIRIADGQTLTDGTNFYSGTTSANAIGGKTLRRATQADYIQACLGADNDGSAEHPYTISDADGWNAFCDALQDNTTWNRFSGKTVKLGNSISVTRMAGSNDHRFMGTFDGQGHTLTVSYVNTDNNTMTAPFSYVDGATIRNLVVGGSITGSAHRAAGIIGETSDNLSHITNCVSSVNISGGRYTAGFSVGGNVAIEGCVFNGKIVGTQYSGGFVGWSYSGLAITNCLFAPQDGSSISGGTFYYNGGGGDITPTNSYYTTALGTAQGTAPYIYTSKPESIGTEGTTYSVSGITPYTDGLGYGGKYYMAEAATFNLTANLAGGAYWSTFYSNACNYQAPDGTQVFAVKLTGTTLTMTEIEDRIVKSGEGVVLKNSTTGSIEMTQTENTPTGNFDGNSLKGTMKAITNPGNAYVLNTGSGGVGFYKLNASGTIGAHKAYLTSSALAREFFGFDEEATGIASMADGGSMKSDVWHTLDGRRLSGKPTTKGVFIHNGRKEVLK